MTSMKMARKASHAGSWYSDDPTKLAEELQGWLKQAKEEVQLQQQVQGEGRKDRGDVAAIIAPHAGYAYSGCTAAHAYQCIEASRVRRIFVLGPSHYKLLKGCAVTSTQVYETPMGDLEIDEVINDALKSTGVFDVMTLEVDETEHSIEMHLPYIAKIMKGHEFKIVPILVGEIRQNLEAYGKIFTPYLSDPSNLFIISSDFCHWGSRFGYQPYDRSVGQIHEYIQALDQRGIELITRQDLRGFESYLDATQNTICGRSPISLLLKIVQLSTTKIEIEFVKYDQSSPCMRSKDSSVSYASAVFRRL